MEACKITNNNGEIYYYLPDLNRFLSKQELEQEKKQIKDEAKSVNNNMSEIDKEVVKQLICSEANQLILAITEDCNMQCNYCINSGEYPYERKRKKKDMSFNTAKIALDDFAVRSKLTKDIHVSFYGGEPFISPLTCNTIRMVCNYARQIIDPSKLKFSATTNGLSLDNQDRLDLIIGNQIFLSVSLDGPEDIHDKNRISNGNGTFRNIINNLELIQNIDNDYYDRSISFICTIAGETNLKERNDFFVSSDLVKNHNLMVTFKNPFDLKSNIDGCNIPMLENNIDFYSLFYEYINCCIEGAPEKVPLIHGMYSKTISMIFDRINSGTNEHGFPINGICAPCHRRTFISTDGTYHICEKITSAFPLGEVFSGLKVDDAINLAERYRMISKDECAKCWARHLCDLCYVSARKGYDLDAERKKENCATKKAFLASALIIYASMIENAPGNLKKLFGKY